MNFFLPKNILLVIGDLFIAILSVYAGIYLRLLSSGTLLQEYLPIWPRAVIYSLFIVFLCFFVDLYDTEKRDGKKEIFLKILFAGLFAFLVLGAVYYFIPSVQLGRGMLFLAVCISILAQSVWHIVYDFFLKMPVVSKKVLILGTGPIAKTMGKLFNSGAIGFALAGYVTCTGEQIAVPHNSVLGNGEGLLAVALREKAQKIVVSLGERRGMLPIREMLNCKLQGIDIIDGPTFYEQMTGKLLIENMNPSHLIFSDGFRITVFRNYIKRISDVFISVAGIIFASPLFIIVPLLIKMDSKGSILFKQRRVGEREDLFTVYKFRTMVEGAEKTSGPVWSQAGDSRITRLGSFLRKTRIDELPQLFNVIKGNMSFIGPRPERPFFVETLKKQIPYYSERHCIKPGLTGWAQVRYEYGDSIEDAIEKLRYDLYYIKYQSISIDLLIVLDTIKVILFGRGGR